MAQGPLSGLKVIEFAGLGPAPFAAMLLSDMGADVLRIDRQGGNASGIPLTPSRYDILARGRRSVALNLKQPDSIDACIELMTGADVLIEGFRPGVMERLGLGPEVAHAHNPRLVYGRMTGWGQTGPYAQLGGHDLNYISITGALSAIGVPEKPVAPLNLAGDFGGGALYLAFGIAAAVVHAQKTGEGQVIDCAMSDGAASLMSAIYGMRASGAWTDQRASNLIDGGAHCYDTYQCADGKWVSVAPLEPVFYRALLAATGLEDPDLASQFDPARWPEMKARLAAIFATRTQQQWCDAMEGVDACFAPILDMAEAPRHPHNIARGTFTEVAGVLQPAPAPRFSKTPGAIQSPPPEPGEHNVSALRDWQVSPELIERLFGTQSA